MFSLTLQCAALLVTFHVALVVMEDSSYSAWMMFSTIVTIRSYVQSSNSVMPNHGDLNRVIWQPSFQKSLAWPFIRQRWVSFQPQSYSLFLSTEDIHEVFPITEWNCTWKTLQEAAKWMMIFKYNHHTTANAVNGSFLGHRQIPFWNSHSIDFYLTPNGFL